MKAWHTEVYRKYWLIDVRPTFSTERASFYWGLVFEFKKPLKPEVAGEEGHRIARVPLPSSHAVVKNIEEPTQERAIAACRTYIDDFAHRTHGA